jgi:hypothetical protein
MEARNKYYRPPKVFVHHMSPKHTKPKIPKYQNLDGSTTIMRTENRMHPIPRPPYRPIITQANPTKLITAFLTSHMITSISLLYVGRTARTRFCSIRNRPRTGLFFIFLLPPAHAVVVLLTCFAFVVEGMHYTVLCTTGIAGEYRTVDAAFVDLAVGAGRFLTPVEGRDCA